MNKVICGNCIFWVRDYTSQTQGFCRRYPPIHKVDTSSDVFPYTSNTQWCGEFKERHDK